MYSPSRGQSLMGSWSRVRPSIYRRLTATSKAKNKGPIYTWNNHVIHRALIEMLILLWSDGFLKQDNKIPLLQAVTTPKIESTSTDEIASNLKKKELFTDRGVLQEWISTCSFYLYSVRLYSCERYLKVNETLHGRMHLLCSGLKYVRISSTKRTGNMCCWIQNWQTLHSAVYFPIQTQHNEDVFSFIKFSV